MAAVPSKDFLYNILEESMNDNLDKEKFQCEPVAEGEGFISQLYRISFGERTFIVKVTNPHMHIEADIGGSYRFVKAVHNRELAVYEWMKRLSKTNIPVPTHVAHFYSGTPCSKDSNGVIIMEDLSERIFRENFYVGGLKMHQMLQLVEQFVIYQSAYLSSEDVPVLEDVEFHMRADNVFFSTSMDKLPDKPWWSEMKTRNGMTRKDTMKHWATFEQVRQIQQEYPSSVQDLPLVLCHSDLWPNNILWEKTDDDSDYSLLAIVDWQCTKPGVCLLDLATPFAMCFDGETRRANLETVLRFYVQEMNGRSCSFKIPFDITYEKAVAVFESCQRLGALLFMMVLVGWSSHDEGGKLSKRFQELLEDMIPS